MKDRRKPWQKKANVKWSRCGTMLAENAAAFNRYDRPSIYAARDALESRATYFPAQERPSIEAAGRSDPWTMLYALAWATAWKRDWRDFPGLCVDVAQIELFA